MGKDDGFGGHPLERADPILRRYAWTTGNPSFWMWSGGSTRLGSVCSFCNALSSPTKGGRYCSLFPVRESSLIGTPFLTWSFTPAPPPGIERVYVTTGLRTANVQSEWEDATCR
eukprot:340465-Rhodomonas_salina.4